MKKLLLTIGLSLGLAVTASAQAHEWHGGYRGYYHGGCYGCGNWVAPAIIGGVIGYELSRPNTVVVEQPSVVYTQPQVVVQQPPAGYHWQEMIDPQTNTKKIVLVPNQ